MKSILLLLFVSSIVIAQDSVEVKKAKLGPGEDLTGGLLMDSDLYYKVPYCVSNNIGGLWEINPSLSRKEKLCRIVSGDVWIMVYDVLYIVARDTFRMN